MTSKTIDYSLLVERALRQVVKEALRAVAANGLPGRHHLYITFRTGAVGVVLPDILRARYPNEMTIVLQHEFWNLEVTDGGFGITLKFSNVPHRLRIPFDAVTVFADPSVEFGLQFQPPDGSAGEAPVRTEAAPKPAPAGQLPKPGRPVVVTALPKLPAGPQDDAAGAEVVTLDQFRKK
jgi:uncharacterized protein